jgi:predicted oxidoreductase
MFNFTVESDKGSQSSHQIHAKTDIEANAIDIANGLIGENLYNLIVCQWSPRRNMFFRKNGDPVNPSWVDL